MNKNEQSQLQGKEFYESKKREKQGIENLQHRKKTIKKIAVLAAVVLFVAVSAYGLALWVGKSTKERPGQAIAIQGVLHIEVGASHPPYNSNPPTSGWHYSNPADWGVHQQELPDEQVLHNLEHGGIWISYKDIDDGTKTKLENLAKKYSSFVVLSPRSANDVKIALASWGRLDKLEVFDEARITNFIKRNKNKSPEPIAR